MELLQSVWWLIPATFVTGVITASIGAGGGVLLLGLMGLALPPLAVVPVHGAVMVWQNLTRALMLKRFTDWHYVSVVAVGSLAGACIAAPLAVSLNPTALQIILGLGLLYLVWAPKLKQSYTFGLKPKARMVVLAVLTSIVSMVIGAAGVLFAAIRKRSGHSKEQLLADQSSIMTVQHGLKIIAFGGFGFAFGPYLPLLVAMALAGLVGTWFGVVILKKVNADWFDHLFKLVVTIMALLLLVKALGL